MGDRVMPLTVGDVVRLNALRHPEKTALVTYETGEKVTWEELNRRVNSLAHALAAQGIRKGNRVFDISNEDHRHYEITFALAKLGAIHVTINTMLSAGEQAYILNNSEPTAGLICQEYADYFEKNVRPKLEFALKETIGVGGRHGYKYDYESLIAQFPADEPKVEVAETDVHIIMYTGGTTAPAKGALWTHRGQILNGLILGLEAALRPNDVYLNFVPNYTTAGHCFTTPSFLRGNTIVTMKWSPESVLDAIERYRATVYVIVPTQLLALLNAQEKERRDIGSVRLMYTGSAPMPFTTLKWAMETFPGSDFMDCYGGTEAQGPTTLLRPDDHIDWGNSEKKRRRLEHPSVGRPMIGTSHRVVDEYGQEVPKDGKTIGQIECWSPTLVSGYWKLPEEKVREHLRDNCWYQDLGFWDEDGYFYPVARKVDMIISGGFNVYATNVERVLYQHPAVNEVIVVGVPDEKWGEAVKAVVRLKEGATATEQGIIDFAGQHLAKYAVPKSVDFVDDFPRSGYKILKRIVRDKYWEGRERKI